MHSNLFVFIHLWTAHVDTQPAHGLAHGLKKKRKNFGGISENLYPCFAGSKQYK